MFDRRSNAQTRARDNRDNKRNRPIGQRDWEPLRDDIIGGAVFGFERGTEVEMKEITSRINNVAMATASCWATKLNINPGPPSECEHTTAPLFIRGAAASVWC